MEHWRQYNETFPKICWRPDLDIKVNIRFAFVRWLETHHQTDLNILLDVQKGNHYMVIYVVVDFAAFRGQILLSWGVIK